MVFSDYAFTNSPPLRVYRQLEKEYVDSFFKDGALYLKTFEDFATHNDASRCDPEEGKGILRIHYNQYCMETKMGVGYDHLVLCTSLIDSGTALCDSYNSCFAIVDVEHFVQAVQKSLQNKYNANVFCMFGRCIYQDRLELDVQGSRNDIQNVPPSPDLCMKLSFLKREQYAWQNEYRFMFKIMGSQNQRSQLIYVPEAIQFCERIR